MRFHLSLAAMALAMSPAIAQEGVDCDAIYDEIVADHPMDVASCEVTVAEYTLKECTPPTNAISARPKSHLILAMDASGSMAGRIGNETKMEIAKREALAFLRELPPEIKVGLVVYGHRGTNQEEGKAESCAASELIHDVGASRRQLTDSISSLSPTGWTPLGGVLEFSATIVAGLKPPREGDMAPVVYLISDGEETCDGDPVAAAASLYEAGVQTTVNTIGFDVDAETGAQLQAIADAAGGTYFPAKDAQALREQLKAIRGAEGELTRYQYCVNANAGRIAMVYHNASIKLVGCYQRNNPTWRQSAVLNAMNKAKRDDLPSAVCADELQARVADEVESLRGWLEERYDPLVYPPLQLIEDYRASAKLEGAQGSD